MSLGLRTLIGKLNETCKNAFTRAASICVSKAQYEVEIEHLLLALGEEAKCDFSVIAKKCGIDLNHMASDVEHELSKFKAGSSRTPVFSPYLIKLLEHGWLIASLDTKTNYIRSAHLLIALLTEADLAQIAHRASQSFAMLNVGKLKHDLPSLVEGSKEEQGGATVLTSNPEQLQDAVSAGTAGSDNPSSATPNLDKFTFNLTKRARSGDLDPVVGRETEIRQMIDILMRRRQNNPILTGEAGVGKTAVVEGLALRIAAQDVPDRLRNVDIHTLDMALLQAGASVKGEFENRLKCIVDEVAKSAHPIILFIDEAHTMIGAGGQAGQNDAANLLKPALARGELRTIGATTWSEYKKYFEKDTALARRFQLVKVEEPTEEVACAMLRGLVSAMETHFHLKITDEAIQEAVRLSHRYINGRQLPDKAVSVLDTACARVALSQNSTPERIELLSKQLERIDHELIAISKENDVDHQGRLDELTSIKIEISSELDSLRQRCVKEIALVNELNTLAHIKTSELFVKNASSVPDESYMRENQQKRKNLVNELRLIQGDNPLIHPRVDKYVIAEVVSNWTGIPLGKMIKDELKAVIDLEAALEKRVLGQPHALNAVAERIRISRANLNDPNKPKGVFLFVGPSGVGKTETALALADILYGGERKLITINMSEYQEAHSVAGLKGSPPGYVGFGEGGVLTEAVRRAPYSVVLLDEVEKAHPDVLELFFQVFDKGVMDDAEGREIDFKNTIIILTSNVASAQIMQACLNKDRAEIPSSSILADAIRPTLVKIFKPAFLGRLDVIPFFPISDNVLIDIVRLKLDRIAQRVKQNYKAELIYDSKVAEAILQRCTEVDSGARNIDNIINGSLLPRMANGVLSRIAQNTAITKITASITKHGDFRCAVK